MVITNAINPLSSAFISQLYSQFLSDTYGHKRLKVTPIGYRKSKASNKFEHTVSHSKINSALSDSIKKYEASKIHGLNKIIDFHVKFECIRPLEDCNGRIDRLIMLKEYLRNNIPPFIINNKKRHEYLEGIRI